MSSDSNHPERRHFQRLELADAALAIASDGLELGVITEASGGGLSVRVASDAAFERLRPGAELRVRVVEGGATEVAAFQARVCSVREGVAGLEFI